MQSPNEFIDPGFLSIINFPRQSAKLHYIVQEEPALAC
jgi:hypothetical protein